MSRTLTKICDREKVVLDTYLNLYHKLRQGFYEDERVRHNHSDAVEVASTLTKIVLSPITLTDPEEDT